MSRIRVLVASFDNGNNETVYFTEDMDAPAEDFFAKGMAIDEDQIIENVLPTGFPTERELKVSY